MPIKERPREPLYQHEILVLNNVEEFGLPKNAGIHRSYIIERLIERGCLTKRGEVTELGKRMRNEYYSIKGRNK